MDTCGIIIPTHGHYPAHGEPLPCLRPHRHDLLTEENAERHLVRLSTGEYFLWYEDISDVYDDKDDEDFLYYEISEEEAQQYLKGVTP